MSRLDWEKDKRNHEQWDRQRTRTRPRISAKGRQPATDKQLRYIASLARQLGRETPTPTHRVDARNLITQLQQQLKVKRGGGRNPNSST